jgi:hypothetical protein
LAVTAAVGLAVAEVLEEALAMPAVERFSKKGSVMLEEDLLSLLFEGVTYEAAAISVLLRSANLELSPSSPPSARSAAGTLAVVVAFFLGFFFFFGIF